MNVIFVLRSLIELLFCFALICAITRNWGIHAVIPKKVFEPYGVTLDGGTDTVATSRQSLGDADIALSAATVHWGYFSKELEPVLTVTSGQEVSTMSLVVAGLPCNISLPIRSS
jgi:hypothetical protein